MNYEVLKHRKRMKYENLLLSIINLQLATTY